MPHAPANVGCFLGGEWIRTSTMVKNLGNVDRAVRAAVGLLLMATMFTWPHTIWGLIGILPFCTAVLGYSPLYRLFGFSTCPLRRD